MNWWDYMLTQGFGPTNEPLDSGYGGYANYNKGHDYGVPLLTPITAIVGGTVVSVGDIGDGWGVRVWVRDAQGYIHNFGHLDSANVQAGQTVAPGQVVGLSGNSGKSTGPHISYDVWEEATGSYVDPSPYIEQARAAGSPTQVSTAGGPAMPAPSYTPEETAILDSVAKRVLGDPAATWASLTPDNPKYITAVALAKELGVDVTPAAAKPVEVAKPQGAVTRSQLEELGANFSVPGQATLQDGTVYKQNPDGTYGSPAKPAADPNAGKVLSGEGFTAVSKAGAPASKTGPVQSQAGVTSLRYQGGQAPTETANFNYITQEEAAKAAATPGTQVGDFLGSTLTPQGKKLPITYGGIYEGGGMKPIISPSGAPLSATGVYYPYEGADPVSIGQGLPDANYIRDILGPAGSASVLAGKSAGQITDIGMNLQSMRQGTDPRLQVDLPALASLPGSTGRPGTHPSYINALAAYREAIGQPLSQFELYLMQQEAQQPMPNEPEVDETDLALQQQPLTAAGGVSMWGGGATGRPTRSPWVGANPDAPAAAPPKDYMPIEEQTGRPGMRLEPISPNYYMLSKTYGGDVAGLMMAFGLSPGAAAQAYARGARANLPRTQPALGGFQQSWGKGYGNWLPASTAALRYKPSGAPKQQFSRLPAVFARGGEFVTDGMKAIVDVDTGKPEVVFGDQSEKVTITPQPGNDIGRAQANEQRVASQLHSRFRSRYSGKLTPQASRPAGGSDPSLLRIFAANANIRARTSRPLGRV
ncbi:MAG: hypothetical protein A3E01_15355 [Gammaproteobacteria bacterium RIFCSPHIGHO2_12_FULL_63_22]|nr:MAG: hypothetical protein A3E01_15355 [Gammaproteobacteria bacterium RIFCSPHIGHO2_12_FULL_63_22]